MDKLNEKNIGTSQESSADGSNLMHENYMKLKNIAEGLLNGRYTYMKFHAPGFMDLVAEKIWSNRISLSHYYEQNGDLMADPDVELIVDTDNEILKAATFQQDNLAIYQSAYNGDTVTDEYLADELNGFVSQWLDNIVAQGHKPYKAHYSDDVMGDCYDVIFDEGGNEVEPDIEEDYEMDM